MTRPSQRILFRLVPAALLTLAMASVLGFGGHAQDLDMDVIFRCHGDDEQTRELCETGRSLIIDNCTSCHTFVPIVMQQFDADGWEGLLDRHRDRAGHLSDEQIATIHAYVSANFNDQQEPPPVPPEMLQNWTAY